MLFFLLSAVNEFVSRLHATMGPNSLKGARAYTQPATMKELGNIRRFGIGESLDFDEMSAQARGAGVLLDFVLAGMASKERKQSVRSSIRSSLDTRADEMRSYRNIQLMAAPTHLKFIELVVPWGRNVCT